MIWYSCNPGIGSNNLLWKVITRLQVISGNHLVAATAKKYIASNFAKLDKFKRVDFRRWQEALLLSSMSVVYVLTTPIFEDDGDNPMVKQIRKRAKRAKWDNDDHDCRDLILNASKKFFVSNFTNYKMTDSRPIMEQYNELLGILGRLFTQHKMNMDETIQEELTLVKLGSHLRIEESFRVQDSDKPKGNNVAGPSVSIWWSITILQLNLCKMMMLHGGLTQEQQFMYVKIDAGRYGVSVPALTKDHKGKKFNTSSVETKFSAIALNDDVSSEKMISCEPTVSSLNNEIDFRVLFDDSNNEDYTVSMRRILGYGYGVSNSCTTLGPREEISTNIGEEFTNLEIVKCWSLETSRRPFNTNSCPINSTWRIYRENTRGVSHSNSF
nr:hypothetical protein [Tanacetum cinerariifolium]